MSDALDDLRADEADSSFAGRQRSATRALVREYAEGQGPAIAEGLAATDRMLDVLDAEKSASADPEQTPAPADPLADFDAVLRFYGIDPVALRTLNPIGYLVLGQAYFIDLARMQAFTHAAMVATLAMARAVAECRPYVAAPGARNALRHSLHQMGVLR